MIMEASYIEIMKNCSKWNCRIETERKGRYPVLDAQTGTASKPSNFAFPTISHRYPPANPSQVCTYSCNRWKKRSAAPSSDATEMKYIMLCNPAIAEAINQATEVPPSISTESLVSSEPNPLCVPELPLPEKRANRTTFECNFDNELDEPSENEIADGSDEDDWSEGKKRKRKKAGGNAVGTPRMSGRKGPSSHANTPQPTILLAGVVNDGKAFSCSHCGAKYKSRAGLNYHRAHVHPDAVSPCGTPQPSRLVSPSIDVSTICDLCLGDSKENAKTRLPETLVSCHDCGRSGHPSCLNFTDNMITSTVRYGWQCIECKSCAICGTSDNDDQLLFCDDCDRGFHLYCLTPQLSTAPEGVWSCHLCQKQFGPRASLPVHK